jgi:tetratricopeptide (TPR) repeat protein
MKKLIYVSITLLSIYSVMSSCQNINASTKNEHLLNRTDTIGKSEEWNNIQKLYKNYTQTIAKDSTDTGTKIKLIELYLNEARVSGNQSHYYALAMRSINEILNNKATKPEYMYAAFAHKASVLLSLHQFADAQKNAAAAVALNPFEADIYGALIDANVELGNYSTAVQYCDKMLSIRPDLRSYSRASYIRQLAGDTSGAIVAMQMAVDAGAAGMENTEWARVNLGDLYLAKGILDTAKFMYESALAYRPNYVHAQMGLARLAMKNKQYDAALTQCKNAISNISESSFISYMAKVYEAKGDLTKAKEINTDVLNLLLKEEAANEKETLIKHNGNRELSMAYLETANYEMALTFAKKDLAMRPKNMDANELVSKIYGKMNDATMAMTFAKNAMAKNMDFAGTANNN